MGKPWATSITSCEAVRINPTTNAVDTDSKGNQVRTYLGPGANPYNYGDMTGTAVWSRQSCPSVVVGSTWSAVWHVWFVCVSPPTPQARS
jgi:hypothetical protein